MLDIEEKNLAFLTKNGSIDHSTVLTTMLSVKQGQNINSLLNTTAAAYDLDFLQKAKSVNELTGLKDEDKAILLKHGDKKSLSSLVSRKLGQNNRNLTTLMITTAAAYDLDFLQKAKSVSELTGLKDEDKAILLKHGDKKSLSSLVSMKHGQKDHKAVRSKWALTMTHNRETKRQKMLETLGSKRLFCGFCGATKYFEEGSRVRGTCRGIVIQEIMVSLDTNTLNGKQKIHLRKR
eukprot:g3116.t1 g3116   contig12:1452413-1453117(-)